MRYSIESKDKISVKGYGFSSFAKKSTTDTTKTALKRAIQKTAAATGDLIGKKMVDKITNVSKESKNNKIMKLIMNQKHQKNDTYLQKKDNKLLMN